MSPFIGRTPRGDKAPLETSHHPRNITMNFTCPYCNQPTTITTPNQYNLWIQLLVEQSDKGSVGFGVHAITCPNPDCKKLYLEARLTNAERTERTNWAWGATKLLHTWKLLPESNAKPLHDFIPEPIREDYYEACRIKDLSPKASATLARRCLQGMIRDFWGISKPRLKDEIEALKEKVDPLTWQAIDAVREVGNIGAHMGRDIDLIIDVEPEEAQLLIGLVEQLFEDWYVERNAKEQRYKKIKEMAEKKKVQKAGKGRE